MAKTATSDQVCAYNAILTNAFTVGDIFRNYAPGKYDHRLCLSNSTQNLLIKPNLKKVLPICTDLRRLCEYRLPKNMSDSTLQERTYKPGFMTEEEFLSVMYLLIFQPKLAKQVLGFICQKDKRYIFHVIMVSGKKMTFLVRWYTAEWRFSVDGFDSGLDWCEGIVLMFFDNA